LGLHQVVVLGSTQRSLLCDFCFFGVTAKIFRRNLTWRSNTAGTTSWCAGRRRWCVFHSGGALPNATSRALRSPDQSAFQGNPYSNVELCSITPSTCLGRPQSLGRRRANRDPGVQSSLRSCNGKLVALDGGAHAGGGNDGPSSQKRHHRTERGLVTPVRRAQRPHDRDHPFASMHRLSNSPRLASAFSASVPAATTAFVASN